MKQRLVVVIEGGNVEGVYFDGDPATLEVLTADVDEDSGEFVIAREREVEPLTGEWPTGLGCGGGAIVRKAVKLLIAQPDRARVALDDEGNEAAEGEDG